MMRTLRQEAKSSTDVDGPKPWCHNHLTLLHTVRSESRGLKPKDNQRVERFSYKEKLRELRLFSLDKRKCQGEHFVALQYMKGL